MPVVILPAREIPTWASVGEIGSTKWKILGLSSLASLARASRLWSLIHRKLWLWRISKAFITVQPPLTLIADNFNPKTSNNFLIASFTTHLPFGGGLSSSSLYHCRRCPYHSRLPFLSRFTTHCPFHRRLDIIYSPLLVAPNNLSVFILYTNGLRTRHFDERKIAKNGNK